MVEPTSADVNHRQAACDLPPRWCHQAPDLVDERIVDVSDNAPVPIDHHEDLSRGLRVGGGGISATGEGSRMD